jgi:hypothetical protein
MLPWIATAARAAWDDPAYLGAHVLLRGRRCGHDFNRFAGFIPTHIGGIAQSTVFQS